jgi:hypothetical protein
MTDKERIERILKIINLEYPDRIKLGKRMNEVYKILAMDELELLTLDQYRGQNMDFVLEKLQKEGLALGDTMRQLDRQIAERFNVRVVDLQSDLALLNQFDVENMIDLPKQITQGMSIEPRNKPPEADYYNKLFEEIAEQNPLNVDKDLEEGFKIQDNLETSAADEIDGVGLTDEDLNLSTDEDLNLSTENDNFLLDETDPKNKEKFNEIISNIDEPLDQVVDFDNQAVLGQEYGSGRDITIPVDKDGNVILFRGTDNPNIVVNIDFQSQVGRGEVGYGKGNYYSPNPQYAANYAVPSGRNLYGFSTDIKPNEIINFQQSLSSNPKLAKALGIEEIYWNTSNPNYKSNVTWFDLFNEIDKEDVWNEAIGDYEVTKKSKYGRTWFQNNIDNFKNNGVKAFITTEVGISNL